MFIIIVDLGLCTGYNLCASRRRTLRGLFFTKKSVLKMRIRYVLNFNKKCQNLIIIVDLALCTGYNLCASRRRTLRGLFFTKKSVLEMRIRYFLNFNKKMSKFDNSCRFGPLYWIQQHQQQLGQPRQPRQPIGPRGGPPPTPKPQNPCLGSFFKGLRPRNPSKGSIAKFRSLWVDYQPIS